MPVGNEIGSYEAKFTSIRTVEVHGDERIIEGTYMGQVSGGLSGTVSGTVTFTGTNERGILSDQGVAYLDSGDVISGKGQGVYWSDSSGQWETRAAFMLPEQMIVGEGQINLSDGAFSWSGKIFELT